MSALPASDKSSMGSRGDVEAASSDCRSETFATTIAEANQLEYPYKLNVRHRQKLFVESGISIDVAIERGYMSATKLECAKKWAEEGFISMTSRLPCLVIPLYDYSGERFSFQARPDVPLGGAKYVVPRRNEAEQRLDIHPRIVSKLSDRTVDLWITEGVPKADSAISRGLCCVGLLGVHMGFRKNSSGGNEPIPGWDAIELRERNVYIAFDSDVMTKPQVRGALGKLRSFLQGRGAFVHVVKLEQGPNSEKVGIDDFFVAGNGVKELYALAQTEFEASFDDGGRPAIDVRTGDLNVVTQKTLEALRASNDPAELFLQGGRLVRVELDEAKRAVVRELSPDGVRYEMAVRIAWFSLRDGVRKPERPQRDVAINLLESSNLGFPALRGIIDVPTFRLDGTLQKTPGYDLRTGLYYVPAPGVEAPDVPEHPSDDDVDAARDLILKQLLCDFPFVKNRDRAHAFALALLPFARELIDGPTPLHVIEAPTQGSGKGKLARALLTIGRTDAPSTTLFPSKEEEVEKRLFTFLASGVPSLIFDNVDGLVRSSSLCSALTEPTFTGRILGRSVTQKVSVRTLWAMTSNNATLYKDVARRSIPCRIDPKVERPFQRDVFLHTNLEQWAKENRQALLRSALTLVRAWVVRGRPDGLTKPLGSFEAWSSVMGGILKVAKVPDFLFDLNDFYDLADTEDGSWAAFLAQWFGQFRSEKKSATDVFWIADDCGLVSSVGSDQQKRTRLGKELAKQRDRIIGGYRLSLAGHTGGASRWTCVKVSAGEPELDALEQPGPY